MIDAQGDVVFDGTQFVANFNGSVQHWDTSGNFLGTTALVVWGANSENSGLQRFMIAAGNGYWLTFASATQELSAWDPATGNRLGTTVLVGAGASDSDTFSLSFGNNRVWLNEEALDEGNWQGFPVFAAVPEPGTIMLISTAALGSGFGLWWKRRRSVKDSHRR